LAQASKLKLTPLNKLAHLTILSTAGQSCFAMWKLRFLLIAIATVLSSSSTPVAPDFGKMRVKELRAYLSAQHMDCFGCTEKHEFVSKAQEACEASSEGSSCKAEPKVDKKPRPEAKKKSTKSNPEAKAGSTTNSKARGAPQLALGDQVLGLTLLFGVLVVGLWRCVGCVRRMCFQLRKQKGLCVITMDKIADPYKLPCCRHVCERQAIGKWMASSKYFRKHNDGELERVAACPLCRTMLEPTHVRSLLNELRMAAPIDGDYAFDSGISDSAFPVSAMQPNFILLKTQDELEQEIQQQAAPRAQEEQAAPRAQEEAGGKPPKSNSESPASNETLASTGFMLHEHADEEPSEALGLENARVNQPGFPSFRRGFLL